MAIVFLGMGSNLGDRLLNLEEACRMITTKIGRIIKRSSLYETEAVGYLSDSLFLNRVVEVETELDADALLQRIHKIEQDSGRVRNDKGYTDRTLDIDILLMGDLVLDVPGLCIPHPRMQDRRFVLTPLAELAPELIDPRTGLSIHNLLDRCTDTAKVECWNEKGS
jgi:2-amino-4-hydroxy-6-hydroxymethyldihydropteridine diphosphokinase